MAETKWNEISLYVSTVSKPFSSLFSGLNTNGITRHSSLMVCHMIKDFITTLQDIFLRNICDILNPMSCTAKIVLGMSVSMSIGIIGYVHYKQCVDRERLHDGVIRDVERQQRKKIENVYMLQQQIELTKQLRKMEDH